ncbi:MAG: hypothetical protein ACJ0HN_06840 [Alphaproteobacteria bacterium]
MTYTAAIDWKDIRKNGIFFIIMENVVVVDIEWPKPTDADFVFNADDCQAPQEMARMVALQVPRLAAALKI